MNFETADRNKSDFMFTNMRPEDKEKECCCINMFINIHPEINPEINHAVDIVENTCKLTCAENIDIETHLEQSGSTPTDNCWNIDAVSWVGHARLYIDTDQWDHPLSLTCLTTTASRIHVHVRVDQDDMSCMWSDIKGFVHFRSFLHLLISCHLEHQVCVVFSPRLLIPVDALLMNLVYLEQFSRLSWMGSDEACNGNLERMKKQSKLKQWQQFVDPSDACITEVGQNNQGLCSRIVMVHGKARRYLLKDVFNIPEYMHIAVFRVHTRTILTEVNSSLLQVKGTNTFLSAVFCNLLQSVQARTKNVLDLINSNMLQVQATTKSCLTEELSSLFQGLRRTRTAVIEVYSKMCAHGCLQTPVCAFLFMYTGLLWISLCFVFDHSLKGGPQVLIVLLDDLGVKDKRNFTKLSWCVLTCEAVLLVILTTCIIASLSSKFTNQTENLSEGIKAMNFGPKTFDSTENWMCKTVSKHKGCFEPEFSKSKQMWYLNWFPEGIKNVSVKYIICPASAPGPLEHYFTQKFHGLGMSEKDEMKYEWLRLQTFKNWPHWAIPYPSALAKVGFYYTKEGDKVVCFSCSGVVQSWRQNMSPMEIHRSLFPDCKFLAGTEENYPIPQSKSSDFSPVVTEVLSRTPRRPASNIMQTSDSGLPEANSASRVTITTTTSDSNVTQITSQLDSGFADSGRANGSRSNAGNVVQDSSNRGYGHSQSSLAATEGALSGTFLERMKHEHNRYLTYRTWPSAEINQAKVLAKAGFYYSGLGYKVKCAFCDGTIDYSRPDQEPMSHHTRLFPSCPFVRSQNTGNIPSYPVPGSAPASPPPPVQSDLAMLGIMSDSPKHPEFSLLQARINSFRGWSPEREQKPYDLAVAGFIYAGMSDCVKCFQCDGGLRNWLSGDIPWVEHARWFPQCSHVRLCKGQEFIDTIDEQYPRHGNTNTGGAAANPATVTVIPRNIDSLLSTPAVQSVLEMGYTKEFVKKGVEMYIQQKGSDSAIDAISLVEILLEIQSIGGDSLPETVTEPNRPSQPPKGDAGSKKQSQEDVVLVLDESEIGDELDTKSLREKNRELIEQTLCKICLENKMCITFLPCGHLVSCAECAPALRKCPICRSNIKGRVRVYMS